MYTTTTRDKLCKLNRPTLVLHETLGQIQVFVNKPEHAIVPSTYVYPLQYFLMNKCSFCSQTKVIRIVW